MLTANDIELLLEALESWEGEATNQSMLMGLMGGLLLSENEKDSKNFMDETMKDGERDAKSRKRRAILLKAKLIQMQDEMAPDQLFNQVIVKE